MSRLVEPAEPLTGVRGQTGSVSIIADGSRDGLANPPCCMCGKLVTTSVIELVYRSHQANVAFLDQVQKGKPAPDIALGQIDDKAKVRLNQAPTRRPTVPDLSFQPLLERPIVTVVTQAAFGAAAAQHFICELDFLARVEQSGTANFSQIDVNEVCDTSAVGILTLCSLLVLLARWPLTMGGGAISGGPFLSRGSV